jgi:hypothetical protein
MDINGNDITPESNIIKSHGGDFQTIISAEQAANFSYEMMFSNNLEKAWDPAMLTKQVEAPGDAKFEDGVITWTQFWNGAIAYAIFKNGEFVGLSTDGTFNITVDPAVDELTIRSANMMGGLGAAAHVDGTVGIQSVKATEGKEVIYNLQGVRVNNPGKGIYIINGKKVIK